MVSSLRAGRVTARKFYATRHTFISDALSHGIHVKWLAEYYGTSVAIIEKHYGRYIRSDSREQLERLIGAKTETFTETLQKQASVGKTQVAEVTNFSRELVEAKWSGRVDLNHRLHGPEPCALPS